MIKNNNKMREDMIEDMTMKDGETEELLKSFQKNLKAAEEANKKGKGGPYYYVLRKAIW
jgi:hypothetical protein